ncbi:hypothetical protein [uncultured Campylobacter sp.]|uniref:hypothetical protein n=1 Tax=uncultured Campylobacter sp. TaxID=218934 RepID=UPI0026233353|nr:hypothetical protein [uncultured Campylobacter sp.]
MSRNFNDRNSNININAHCKKELIIKDFSALIGFCQFCILILIIILSQTGILSNFGIEKFSESEDSYFFIIFCTIIPFIRIIERDKPFNRRFIIFNEKFISVEVEGIKIFRINLDEIIKISKNMDTRTSTPEYFPISKELFYFCIFATIITMILFVFKDFIVVFILLATIFILPKNLICTVIGGLEANKIYDRLAIYSKDGIIINIFINSNKDYSELKRYFLLHKSINIDNVRKEFTIFQKEFKHG